MIDQFNDIQALLPRLHVQTIFDIGANIGQSSAAYRAAAPDATIYAFEPVRATFAKLSEQFVTDRHVQCFQLAFGDQQGLANIQANVTSVSNKIVASNGDRTERVQVVTGDGFCTTHRIDRIGLLKIDTEGYDLKVCRGFEKMLAAGKVDLVQVEAGLHPKNALHVPFQAFKDYLEPLGYSIFRIYDQAGAPTARRCNIVFISDTQALRNMNTKARKAPMTYTDWL